MRTTRAVGTFILAASLGPIDATAQEARPPVTFSVGSGWFAPYQYPDRAGIDILGSVQFPVGRLAVLEGELLHSAGGRDLIKGGDNRLDRPFETVATFSSQTDRLSLSANLLFRTPGRVSLFGGAGLGAERASSELSATTACIPRAPGACDSKPSTENRRAGVDTHERGQLLGGLDVRITDRLTAFASTRWRYGFEPGLGAAGGLRIAAGSRSATGSERTGQHSTAADAGSESQSVRVTSVTGRKRTGTLLSLSPSEVVFREDGVDVKLPLAEVRRVERISHEIRNFTLASAAAGFVVGYFASCGGGDENDCWPEVGALVAGIGAGAGALIGAGVKASRADRNLLYQSPGSARALHVTPILSRHAVGVNLSISR